MMIHLWPELATLPVGTRVFTRHFLGQDVFDGQKGTWATVTGDPRNKHSPFDLILVTDENIKFFHADSDNVGITPETYSLLYGEEN